MNNIKRLFSIICVIVYLIPVYGQKDTITAEGLYLKYNIPSYHRSNLTMQDIKKILDGEMDSPAPKDSDMERGELARITKFIGLTYKALPQYIISETFYLKKPPLNPKELLWTTGSIILSQWIHEDGECILFIKCSGDRPIIKGKEMKPNKSIDRLPINVFGRIRERLNVTPMSFKEITEEEIQEIKKKITMWPPEKAKETFNAQYVITYPIKSKKSVYMGKYTHKMDLMMTKWGEHLTVSFLVTKKGNKNIEKYIKDVEEAFWFED